MGLSVIKSLSILVASGHGDRCNLLRSALRDHLLQVDEETGLMKIHLHKNCKSDEKLKDAHYRVGRELGKIIRPILSGIPTHFYGPDADTQEVRN